MNSLNVHVQLLTIEAARTKDMSFVYQAALIEPHTAAQLSTDEIVAMCDELAQEHEKAGFPLF
jgi:alpha-galactosidase